MRTTVPVLAFVPAWLPAALVLPVVWFRRMTGSLFAGCTCGHLWFTTVRAYAGSVALVLARAFCLFRFHAATHRTTTVRLLVWDRAALRLLRLLPATYLLCTPLARCLPLSQYRELIYLPLDPTGFTDSVLPLRVVPDVHGLRLRYTFRYVYVNVLLPRLYGALRAAPTHLYCHVRLRLLRVARTHTLPAPPRWTAPHPTDPPPLRTCTTPALPGLPVPGAARPLSLPVCYHLTFFQRAARALALPYRSLQTRPIVLLLRSDDACGVAVMPTTPPPLRMMLPPHATPPYCLTYPPLPAFYVAPRTSPLHTHGTHLRTPCLFLRSLFCAYRAAALRYEHDPRLCACGGRMSCRRSWLRLRLNRLVGYDGRCRTYQVTFVFFFLPTWRHAYLSHAHARRRGTPSTLRFVCRVSGYRLTFWSAFAFTLPLRLLILPFTPATTYVWHAIARWFGSSAPQDHRYLYIQRQVPTDAYGVAVAFDSAFERTHYNYQTPPFHRLTSLPHPTYLAVRAPPLPTTHTRFPW